MDCLSLGMMAMGSKFKWILLVQVGFVCDTCLNLERKEFSLIHNVTVTRKIANPNGWQMFQSADTEYSDQSGRLGTLAQPVGAEFLRAPSKGETDFVMDCTQGLTLTRDP